MNHDVPPSPPPDETRLADKRLEISFRILVFAGLGFILLGSAAQLFVHKKLLTDLTTPERLISSLFKLQPQAFTTLGFVILMLGPALGLLVLVWTYLRQRERLIPLVALIVFTIILLSVPIEHWTRGS